MEGHIANIQKILDKENIGDDQARWELENFHSNFQWCCQENQNSNFISRKKKKLLEYTSNYLGNFQYITFKSEFYQLHDGKANGIRIRNKCDLYEYGQKSIKSLLNLKKIRAHQKKTRNILKNCKG